MHPYKQVVWSMEAHPAIYQMQEHDLYRTCGLRETSHFKWTKCLNSKCACRPDDAERI